MLLLNSTSKTVEDVESCQSKLDSFVDEYEQLYGAENVKICFHELKYHLIKDELYNGPNYCRSGFTFENKISKLSAQIKSVGPHANMLLNAAKNWSDVFYFSRNQYPSEKSSRPMKWLHDLLQISGPGKKTYENNSNYTPLCQGCFGVGKPRRKILTAGEATEFRSYFDSIQFSSDTIELETWPRVVLGNYILHSSLWHENNEKLTHEFVVRTDQRTFLGQSKNAIYETVDVYLDYFFKYQAPNANGSQSAIFGAAVRQLKKNNPPDDDRFPYRLYNKTNTEKQTFLATIEWIRCPAIVFHGSVKLWVQDLQYQLSDSYE